jgi:hypothetical protein
MSRIEAPMVSALLLTMLVLPAAYYLVRRTGLGR